MASLTVENYLKAIYQICAGQEGKPAATGQIAALLDVLPGTVTSMLKTLSESKLATYTPYEGASLTSAGKMLALRVVRRHRLIELFLVKTLNFDWDEVHDDAEQMEHAVSDLLVDRIDAFLGYPENDPHGDPIPQADGTMNIPENSTLTQCSTHQKFRLARVLDQSSEFLRFLTESGLPLGVEGQVMTNSSEAKIVTVEISGQKITLGYEAAEKILVVPHHSPSEKDQ